MLYLLYFRYNAIVHLITVLSVTVNCCYNVKFNDYKWQLTITVIIPIIKLLKINIPTCGMSFRQGELVALH